MYLTAADVARAVHICEVLPIGIHLTVVGAALTVGAAVTWWNRLIRVSWAKQGKKTKIIGTALTRGLSGVLAEGWGTQYSPTHWYTILTRAGSAGLVIGFPLDPFSKLLSIEHTGYSKGGRVELLPWEPKMPPQSFPLLCSPQGPWLASSP
jgi:hypothetical protein